MDFIYLAALALFAGLIAAFAKGCARLAGVRS
jgi:hypothetical protein